MKRLLAAAAIGALTALGVTAGALQAGIAWLASQTTVVDFDAPGVLLLTLTYAGPGFLILGFLLSVALRARTAPRGSTLLFGLLLGLPAGLLHLAALTLLFLSMDDLKFLFRLDNPFSQIMLAVALVGGATLGFACAWWLSRPQQEEK